jgi:branched-chain amino acid transport system permease protein
LLLLFVQLLINGVYVGSVYALLGLSFAIIFATSKVWHFAQGAVYTVAAYAVLGAEVLTPMPLPLATLVGAVVGAAGGVLCLVLLYEPLQRRNTAPLVIVMGSLGVTGMVENLLALAFGPTGYGLPGESWPPFLWGGLIVSVAQLIAPAAMLAAVIGAILVLSWTGLGRRLRALMGDDELLGLQGVDTTRLKRLAFAAGSALLALPAVLLLMSGAGVTPFVGIDAVLTGAMSVFVGGAGSLAGAAAGGFLIGLIENLAAFFVPTEWQVPVTYALLLAFLLLRPTGLLGRGLARSTI